MPHEQLIGTVSYAQFAALVSQEPDWRFLIRLLRESVLAAGRLTDQDAIDIFHGRADSTGHEGWDALIAGVATISGWQRVSGPDVLDWCYSDRLRCREWFDPLNSGKYLWLEYMRTPIELRERNVVLAAGNLQGV